MKVFKLFCAVLFLTLLPSPATASERVSIIVTLDSGTVAGVASDYGIQTRFDYHSALHGFAASVSPTIAEALAEDPRVSRVEADGPVTILETAASWGLDRIDQRDLPLDGIYSYEQTGVGVTAYVIDTGIRFTHTEFGGRAVSGIDTVDPGTPADDCHGHGTHVSGTIGGKTYGVAKQVTLVAVRVINCSGSGTWAQVIAGVDWVTADHSPGMPAVANMSLGGGYNQSLNDAVAASVADGITYVVAAGNSNADACNYSPASAPTALTVGATGGYGSPDPVSDSRASFSNWGTCLDIFAPGVKITSAWLTDDTATAVLSGTSMASPHVAGTVVLYLSVHPLATPAEVEVALEANATPDKVIDPGTGSPNLLDYSLGFGTPAPPTIVLTATRMRLKGFHVIDLDWTPVNNPDNYVEVRRDGETVATVFDDGNYTDVPGTKGQASYAYQVCYLYGGTCSNTIIVQYGNKDRLASCDVAPHGCYRARPLA